MINIPESVKDALKKDRSRKDFIAHFPNGERADITNENVVKNAVKFAESLCSKQYLKFGLTEASMLQFETMGVENIIGREIECAYNVYSHEIIENEDIYTKEGFVPLGRFTVKSCPRNHENMTRRKVTAYSSIKDGSDGYEAFKLKDRWHLDSSLTIDVADTVNALLQTIPSMYALAETSVFDYAPILYSSYIQQCVSNSTEHIKIATSKIGGLESTWFLIFSEGVINKISGDNQNISHVEFEMPNNNDTIAQINYVYDNIESADSYTLLVSREKAIECMLSLYAPYIRGYNYQSIREDISISGTGRIYFYRPDESTIYRPGNGENVLLDKLSGNSIPIRYGCFFGGAIYNESVGYREYNTSDSGSISIHVAGSVRKYRKSAQTPTITLKSTANQTNNNVTRYSFYESYNEIALINGWLELNALFGKQQRDGSYALKHLSKDTPIEIGIDLIGRLWWNEYDVNPIGSVKYSFKSGSEQQIAVYQFGAGKSEYDMTGNYVLLNMDNASMTNINALLDQLFIPNIGDIGFTPVDLTMKGLPYIEAGDFLQIVVKDDTEVMESSLIYDNPIGYAAEFELPSTELRVYESKIQQVKVEGVIVTDYSVYAEQHAEDSFILKIGLTGYTSGTVTLLYGQREVVETYVMQRSLSGIQSLTDDIESSGGEIIESEVIEDES